MLKLHIYLKINVIIFGGYIYKVYICIIALKHNTMKTISEMEKYSVYRSGEALESGEITDSVCLLNTSDESEAIRLLKKLPDDGMHYIERTTPNYPYWDTDERYGNKFLSDFVKIH